MKTSLQDRLFTRWTESLCDTCRDSYSKIRHELLNTKTAPVYPLDKAIQGQEDENEDEIELYQTYGGD